MFGNSVVLGIPFQLRIDRKLELTTDMHLSKMIQNTLNFRYRNVFQKASIKNCLLTYLQSKPNLDSMWLVL